MWVRVPAGTGTTSKRPVQKTIDAKSGADAAALLRGQYGTSNVVGAAGARVNPPRVKSYRPSTPAYVPKTTGYVSNIGRGFGRRDHVRIKKYKKGETSKSAGGESFGLAILIGVYFLFALFNYFSKRILLSFFGSEKYSYWYKNNKHVVAFALCTMNLIMFCLLMGFAFNYWLI